MSQSRRRSVACLSRVSFALLALAASASLRAQTTDFAIRYHERLVDLAVSDGRPRPQALGREPTSGPSLSFVAFGRRFDIDLRSNDRLTSRLAPEARANLNGIEIYEGDLRNTPRSWVRLTRSRGLWSGAFYDGADLYLIDSYASAAPYLVTPSSAADDEPIIYRWKDAEGRLIDEVGSVVVQPVDRASRQSFPLSDSAPAPRSPGEEIDIGLVGDTQLAQQTGTQQPEVSMISMANVADGIFVTQVGVHLNVTQLELLTDGTTPFDTTDDPPTLLSELASHKAGTPALTAEGIVHLFTPRSFGDSGVLGIAYLGSICEATRSVSLTRVIGGIATGVVTAHEIGHNFGAPHDGAPGGPCESTSFNYLMSPVVNGSDEFSACSLQQMQPVIAGASCLYALPPSDVSARAVSSPAQVLLGTDFQINAAVDNHGADAFAVAVTGAGDGIDVSTVTYSRCTWADPVGCRIPMLSDGASMPVDVSALAARVGHTSVDVSVQSINDSNPFDNTAHVDVDVLPSANLWIERFDVNPTFARPHDTVSFGLDISSHSSIPATQVAVVFRADYGLTLLSFVGADGSCTTQSQFPSTTWTCPLGTLAAGATQHVTGTIQDTTGAVGLRYIEASLVAAEPNLNNLYPSADLRIASGYADLSASIEGPAASQGVQLGDRFSLTLHGHNAGPDRAQNVVLQFVNLDGAMLLDSVGNTDGASCVPISSDSSTIACSVAALPAGADFSVTFSGTAPKLSGGNITAKILSDTYDKNPTNDRQDVFIGVRQASPTPTPAPPTATPPAASGGNNGGGGGATDWLSAVLLTVAFGWHSRSRALGNEARANRSRDDATTAASASRPAVAGACGDRPSSSSTVAASCGPSSSAASASSDPSCIGAA